jgi:hypothetical protein
MSTVSKLARILLFLLLPIFVVVMSCQKMSRPALGKYPVDNVVLPGGNLRFFASFDSASADAKQINIRFGDSISGYPSFFPDKSITVAPGAHGTAFKNGDGVALEYLNANDFSKATSFTIAFWEKSTGVPQSADGPQFVMSLVDKDYWHNSGIFLLFDHTGAGSTADSAAVSFVVKDNWFVFHNKDRMPKIYDKNWHHIAFVYDETTSKLATYVDGVFLSGLSKDATTQAGLTGPLNMTVASVSNLVLGGWNKHVGLSGPTDSWIKNFPGTLDQFRMYNKALSAADIQALYNSKL